MTTDPEPGEQYRQAEVWKGIDGWPEYRVSNRHRVKSLGRRVMRRHGESYPVTEKLLNPCHASGSVYVSLSRPGYRKTYAVPTLVRRAFGGDDG